MVKKLVLLFILLVCGPSLAMNLTSESWHEFGFVGSNYLCPNQGGDNISPQLSWSEAPPNTLSYLLFLHDPDAPHSAGFVHWVVYIDDAKIQSIDTGFTPKASGPIVFGLNGMDKNAYFGPCPPSGTGFHRYIFTLYALNAKFNLHKVSKLHQHELVNSLFGKVIKQTSFTVFYRNVN